MLLQHHHHQRTPNCPPSHRLGYTPMAAIGFADLFVKSRENAAGILWKILSVFFLLPVVCWMLSPFRTMAVCWLPRQCSMISYLAAGAFFSPFWCWLNFRAVVFRFVSIECVWVGRVVEDGGRHLGRVKFNCVCVDRHTVCPCVCVCEVWRVI